MFEVEATSELVLPNGRPTGIINQSSIATGDIARDPQVRQLAVQLGQWVEKARSAQPTGMFDRSLYDAPEGPYNMMRVARHAVAEDDVVSGVADATEALAFDGGLKWESANPDDADIFNQMSADLNLDGKIREMWREQFAVDQFVVAKLWDYVEYTVRGKTENGNKKKKKVRVWAPTRLVVLNPSYVVPIGHGPLREDRLAWQATDHEVGHYQRIRYQTDLETLDPLMLTFFDGEYKPGLDEQLELTQWGVQLDRLLSINPAWVFRHCNTRPDYRKFPDVRLRSVFGLLDLKRQLMASDRAMLVGAANYILLIRKGSKDQPGTQDEITNLKSNYNFLAKLPVIISDHRLEIDVIAPKLDFVLKREAYDALDARILARTLATFVAPGKGSSDAGVSSFSDVLASAIQNRRHMIKRTLEREVSRAVVEHPKNEGIFEDRPSLVFTPRTVSVGISQATMSALLALRTQREVSRDTILEHLGLDQSTEAQRLELEERLYDDIFKTQVPFTAAPGNSQQNEGDQGAATPNATPEAPQNSGRRGGRPPGGGKTAQSPQKQAKPRTDNGNSTKGE